MCLANPDIARKMEQYPVLTKKMVQVLDDVNILICNYLRTSRDIIHALQWRNDTRFHAPMATSPVGSVFVKDVVQSSIAGAICVCIILTVLP